MRYFIIFFLLGGFSFCFGQVPEKIANIRKFQEEMNMKFKDPVESPLTSEERSKFEKLEFFDIDTNFTVTAEFVRTPSEAPFFMPTTTERLPVYVKYGEAYFFLDGKKHKLNVYQNQELTVKPGYEDYLFLPFTDLTNGNSSYGGGRYLDVRIPKSNRLVIDFNKAYNPYCAYNAKYSCPIPPAENDLKIKITAGVKSYENGKDQD